MRSPLLPALLPLALLAACTPAETSLPAELEIAWAEAGPDARLPVLVRHDQPVRLLGQEALSARRAFRHVPLALVELDAKEARRLARRGASLHLDRPLAVAGRPGGFDADPQILTAAVGADRVHQGQGTPALTGQGVRIALVDSGVWADHRDFPRNAVLAGKDFVDRNGDGRGDDDRAALRDPFGHGTMVASVLFNQRDGVRGVSPGVELVSARVLDDNGVGTLSSAVAALDWIIDEAPRMGTSIVHLSVGAAPSGSFVEDPLAMAAEAALNAGLIVVAAAGNFGESDGTEAFGGILSPAIHPGVIAVGASDTQGTLARSDDLLAPFSSRGPTPYDGIGKPDIVAPGVAIPVAARPGSRAWTHMPRNKINRWDGVNTAAGHLMAVSGTSFAAPAVTGTIALMLERDPALTAIGARAALQITAEDLGDSSLLAQGAGQLNSLGAVRLVDAWARGEEAVSPVPWDVIGDEPVRWGLSVLWDGWLLTDADVSELNADGILAVGELTGTGILWDGLPPRYVGVRLLGDRLPTVDFRTAQGIWGTGILWDGIDIGRASSRVWSNPQIWDRTFVWPPRIAEVSGSSFLEPQELAGLTTPVPGASDPRPQQPDFGH